MPTISPSSLLQLCLLLSSKQKVSSLKRMLGHLISSETWISFSLKSVGSRTAPLQGHLDAKIFRLKSFSLFPWAPSSLSPASQLICRVICLALGPWSEVELGPGLYHLSRWLLCSTIPSHVSYTHPSDSGLCQLGSGNESLHSPYLKGKLAPTTPWSSRHVLSLGAWHFHSRQSTCWPLHLSEWDPQNSTHPNSHCRVF